MSEQLALDIPSVQTTWSPPKGRHTCGRDPAAGPGSCLHWWEGCPQAEKRGCFKIWAPSPELLAYWADKAPRDWSAPPHDLHPVTAGHLREARRIEIRTVQDERWEWRLTPTQEPTHD